MMTFLSLNILSYGHLLGFPNFISNIEIIIKQVKKKVFCNDFIFKHGKL